LALKLLFEYGPKLLKVGQEIYRKIEEWAHGTPKVTSEAKAARFDRLASIQWRNVKKAQPVGDMIPRFREKIWQLNNTAKA